MRNPITAAGAGEAASGETRYDEAMTTTGPARTAPASRNALASLLCDVLPPQGAWSDDAYLWLTDHTSRLIEFTDGHVQELAMPTFTQQAVLGFLYRLFHDHVEPLGGVVVFSAMRMRIREGKFREPDLLMLRDRSDPRCRDRYWPGADLVVEIVSPDDPERDLVEKRADYAEGGVPEYWIADPRDETITVLTLEAGAYVEHGVFGRGAVATSPLLDGFAAGVSAVFDAPKPDA